MRWGGWLICGPRFVAHEFREGWLNGLGHLALTGSVGVDRLARL